MSPNRKLDLALRNLRRCAGDLTQLAGQWTQAVGTSVWWDDYYHVFAAQDYRRTYPGLFGSSRAVRAVLDQRSLDEVQRMWSSNRWHGPMDLGLPLPSDAVLIPAGSSKEGVVVLSRRDASALKLNYGRGEVEREVRNWETIEAAGITKHVPILLDHGRSHDGGHWMLTELAPNTQPIERPLNRLVSRHKTWMHWLRWHILPVMERFYEVSGLERVTVDDLLDETKTRMVKDSMPDALFQVARLAEDARLKGQQKHVLITMIHKDIVPEHIHRHAGDWWILDWGSIGPGMTPKEVFRNYFWKPVKDERTRLFWAWLSGKLSLERVPVKARSEIDMYLDWYSHWQSALDSEALRCQLLVSLLRDYHEVVVEFDLRDTLGRMESRKDLPVWVYNLPSQLKALGTRGWRPVPTRL